MPTTDEFKQEQRGVALAMIAALVTTVAVLALVAVSDRTPATLAFSDRLRFALRADIVVIGWLVAAIANVARIRFFSEQDIGGSSVEAGSGDARVASAILQNTFEQVALAIFAHLAVAATFSPSNRLIVALVCLFALGRMLFWAGYKHGAKGRAFGFALTFYPSVLALVACAIATLFGFAS